MGQRIRIESDESKLWVYRSNSASTLAFVFDRRWTSVDRNLGRYWICCRCGSVRRRTLREVDVYLATL